MPLQMFLPKIDLEYYRSIAVGPMDKMLETAGSSTGPQQSTVSAVWIPSSAAPFTGKNVMPGIFSVSNAERSKKQASMSAGFSICSETGANSSRLTSS